MVKAEKDHESSSLVVVVVTANVFIFPHFAIPRSQYMYPDSCFHWGAVIVVVFFFFLSVFFFETIRVSAPKIMLIVKRIINAASGIYSARRTENVASVKVHTKGLPDSTQLR